MSENPLPEVMKVSVHIYAKRLKKPFRLSIVGFLLGFGLVVIGDMTRQNAPLEQVGNGFWAQQSILTSIGFLLISGIVYFGIIMNLAWRSNNPYLYSKIMRRLVIIGHIGYPGWSDKRNFQMARFLPLFCILFLCVLFFPTLLKLIGRLLQ